MRMSKYPSEYLIQADQLLLNAFPQEKRVVIKLLNYFEDATSNLGVEPHDLTKVLDLDVDCRTLIVILKSMEQLGLVCSGFYVTNPANSDISGPFQSIQGIPNNHVDESGQIGNVILLEHVKLVYSRPNLLSPVFTKLIDNK